VRGLFLLALSWHFGARSAGAQGSAAPEVSMLSGVVDDGGTIPLPTYGDGTHAAESECRWTVSPCTLHSESSERRTSSAARQKDALCMSTGASTAVAEVTTAVRRVRSTRIRGFEAPRTTSSLLRDECPVSATPHTLGQLKSRFRDPAPTRR